MKGILTLSVAISALTCTACGSQAQQVDSAGKLEFLTVVVEPDGTGRYESPYFEELSIDPTGGTITYDREATFPMEDCDSSIWVCYLPLGGPSFVIPMDWTPSQTSWTYRGFVYSIPSYRPSMQWPRYGTVYIVSQVPDDSQSKKSVGVYLYSVEHGLIGFLSEFGRDDGPNFPAFYIRKD